MIATHNIKVNGRWIRAGEAYGEEAVKEEQTAVEIPEAAEQEAEPEKTERPKSTRRRSR